MQLGNGMDRLSGIDRGCRQKETGAVKIDVKTGSGSQTIKQIRASQRFRGPAAAFSQKVADAPALNHSFQLTA